MYKKLIFLSMMSILLVSIFVPSISASTIMTEQSNTLSDVITLVDNKINYDESKQNLEISKDDINKIVNKVDLTDIFIDDSSKDVVSNYEFSDMIYSAISETNKELNSNMLYLKDDEIFVEESNYNLQGGKTYTKRFWWGVQRFMSTRAAQNAVYDLRNKSNNAGLLAVLGGVVTAKFFAVGALPFATDAWYYNALANKLEYENNKTSKGIVLQKQYFTSAYKVWRQK